MKNALLFFMLVSICFPLSSAETETVRSLDDLRLSVVVKASSYLGIAYHFGGQDARGLDCSGFINAVFNEYVPDMPRRSMELYYFGRTVDRRNLQPGDLVFFNTTGRDPSHVGLYIGDDHFIHSASAGNDTGVIISSLETEYYRERYTGARRILHLSE